MEKVRKYSIPMNDVGEQIVMFESIVGVDSFVVDCEGASPDTPFVLSGGMSPELPCEDIEDLFPDPSSFGERCKCEVIRINFPKACKFKRKQLK